ncbi:hypothetical protein HMPREF3201_01331 [Megasphaera sp. MJR8396C]|nr:hypothetical protein HMPREF3201_01331 [Megasphaera sp. MJR8396C]
MQLKRGISQWISILGPLFCIFLKGSPWLTERVPARGAGPFWRRENWPQGLKDDKMDKKIN